VHGATGSANRSEVFDPVSRERKNGGSDEIEVIPEDLSEYVIERIVGHRVTADGKILVRVRWFGYDPSQDTWEPVISIPVEIMRRYVKRRRLRPEDYGL
jgi:Chromo (CHRromatin Organisation MOdifier) domain